MPPKKTTTNDAPDSIRRKMLDIQADLQTVQKDGKNPHFNSTYVTLNAVLDEVKTRLNAKHILLMQEPYVPENSPYAVNDDAVVVLYLKTTLYDVDTDDTYEVRCCAPVQRNDPQGIGSAITYLRRYALVALFGLQSEDDDGNAASVPPAKQVGKRGGLKRARKGVFQDGPDQGDRVSADG